jgi:hypothetical protein
MRRIASTLLGLALLAGCSSSKDKDRPSDKAHKDDDDHDHGPGPHKGTVFEFFNHKLHLEFKPDHDKREARIWVLDKNAKKPAPIKCDKLTVSIKDPSMTIEMKPAPQKDDPPGTSSEFVGKHDKLAQEKDYEGDVHGEIDGKPATGKFKEEPEPKKK